MVLSVLGAYGKLSATERNFISDPDTIVWALADTGRMMPAYSDLSRYDTPVMCLLAVKGVESLMWRRREADTLPKDSEVDTIPTAARDVGRRCIAQFEVEAVPQNELYDLIRLAIIISDTSLARIGIERYLNLYEDDDIERSFILIGSVLNAVRNRPALIEFAHSLIKYGDTPESTLDMTSAYSHLIRINRWQDKFDDWRKIVAEKVGYMKRQYPNDTHSLMHFLYEDSLNLLVRAPAFPINEFSRLSYLRVEWRKDEVNSMSRLMAIAGIEGRMDYYQASRERQPPELKFFRKFPKNEAEQPIPGRVTLVVPAFNLGVGRMEPYLARLRRWHERYHSEGLDIILVYVTNGYAWDSPPLEPDEEAQIAAWYYREYLQLPFKVIVEKREMTRLPDGRLLSAPPNFLSHLHGELRGYLNGSVGYIVGRDGLVSRFYATSPNIAEPLSEGSIVRELKRGERGL